MNVIEKAVIRSAGLSGLRCLGAHRLDWLVADEICCGIQRPEGAVFAKHMLLRRAAAVKVWAFAELTLFSLGHPVMALLIQAAVVLMSLPLLVWFVQIGIGGVGSAVAPAAILAALIPYLVVSLQSRPAMPVGCRIHA